MDLMPVILPPLAFDVPAIIQPAAFSTSHAAPVQHPSLSGRPVIARPAAGSQLPDIIRPPAIPAPTTHGVGR
jgi:hypothetical protein